MYEDFSRMFEDVRGCMRISRGCMISWRYKNMLHEFICNKTDKNVKLEKNYIEITIFFV